ncbi:MAG: hypothetical protein AAF805_09875 [Planctomycetota bacterium]
MAYDPLSLNPSDSGLLDGLLSDGLPSVPGSRPAERPSTASTPPPREEYEMTELPDTPPATGDAGVESTLRETPLPEGFLGRLRSLVDEL